MTSPDRRPGDEAASPRKVVFGGLLAASTLAPFPNIMVAAHAQDGPATYRSSTGELHLAEKR
jgi:hypothetical protein